MVSTANFGCDILEWISKENRHRLFGTRNFFESHHKCFAAKSNAENQIPDSTSFHFSTRLIDRLNAIKSFIISKNRTESKFRIFIEKQ